jgi:hypothetical protein
VIILGTKYPFGESPFYPPRDWDCPSCFKHHGKPHFAFPGQLDHSIPVGSYGRVKFNRANKNGDDDLDYSQPIKKEYIGQQGNMILADQVQGLFCPHCGWEEHIINIIPKVGFKMVKGWRSIAAPNCDIKSCTKKAAHTNSKLNFCKEHYELVK